MTELNKIGDIIALSFKKHLESIEKKTRNG
jgi:hypothetical protein